MEDIDEEMIRRKRAIKALRDIAERARAIEAARRDAPLTTGARRA